MWQGIRRYSALGRADRRLLRQAFIGLALADLSLRSASFARLMRHRRTARQGGSGGSAVVNLPERYAHWLEVASRHHVVHARCLHRSLVLHQWLLRDGLASQLKIGVRKEGRMLHAHAWVELDGLAVHEHPGALAAFTPLASPRSPHSSGGPLGDSVGPMIAGLDLWRHHKRATWA